MCSMATELTIFSVQMDPDRDKNNKEREKHTVVTISG